MDIGIAVFLVWLVLMLGIAYYHGDVQAVFEGDPAAKNILEVLTYPGVYAVSMHRVNHVLWRMGIPFVPRLLSQIMRFLTFIEIHPGAQIGHSFFIDHGDGVVIGETAVIGDHVILYHQVTLGGTGKQKGKRHPTVGSHVIIGAGSKILGNIRVGEYCKIGAGTIVIHDVPDHSTVVGNPARVVSGQREESFLNLGDIPDPLQENFVRLEKEISELKKKLARVSHGK